MYFLLIIGLTIWLTSGILRRIKGSGCLSVTYIGLIVLFVISSTFGVISLLAITTRDTLSGLMFGDHHLARVVAYDSYESYDSEDNSYTTMYTPIVEFKDAQGNTIRKPLSSSSSGIILGEVYNVFYTPDKGKVVVLGFTLALLFVVLIVFSFLLGGASLGLILFANNFSMKLYLEKVSQVGFFILIPGLMIGFELLLIYGLFYGNTVPVYVSVILVFFILVLGFAIWGYLKNILEKGAPKMKRIASNKWGANFDEKR